MSINAFRFICMRSKAQKVFGFWSKSVQWRFFSPTSEVRDTCIRGYWNQTKFTIHKAWWLRDAAQSGKRSHPYVKKSFKNTARQNSNRSSNFGCNWTSFHSQNNNNNNNVLCWYLIKMENYLNFWLSSKTPHLCFSDTEQQRALSHNLMSWGCTTLNKVPIVTNAKC